MLFRGRPAWKAPLLARRSRVLFAAAVLAALAGGSAGCSKSSTAPRTTTPATSRPTRFTVFASDRNRSAGSFKTFMTGFDVPGTSGFVFGIGTGIVDKHPSMTGNGTLLVFQSSPGRGGSEDVFASNRVSGAFTDDPNINTNANETDPYISLDGTRLAFVRDTLGVRRIRLYDTQAQRLIPLAGLEAGPSSNDWAPALDEHGECLVFVSDRNGNADVLTYRVSIQTLSAYVPLGSASEDVEPSISGNGRYVVFASNRAGGLGDYDLYLFDLNTAGLVTMAGNSASADRDPSISFDGTYLQFTSNRSGGLGGMDLWFLNRTAGTVQAVIGESSTGSDVDPVIVWR